MKVAWEVILAFCALSVGVDLSENSKTAGICPSVCNDEITNNSTEQCSSRYHKVCPSDIPWNHTIPVEESHDLHLWPIILQNLAVHQITQNTSTYSLEVNWMLQQSFLADGTKVVIRNSISLSQECTIYQIELNAQTKPYEFCQAMVPEVTQVSLRFLILPNNISLEYKVELPDDLNSVTDPSNLSAWRPAAAIAADPFSKSVNVIFQLAPPSAGAQKYILQLYATMPNGTVVDEIELSASMYQHAFNRNLTVNTGYFVGIKAVGCGSAGCPITYSNAVTLLGAPNDPKSTQIPITTTPSASIDVSTTTWATDPSIIVNRADQHAEYEKKKNIIIGTVVGGVGLLVLVAVACFCFHRKRSRRDGSPTWPFQMQRFGRQTSNNNVETSMGEEKESPKILLLYSYDCAAHENVIKKFASYLKGPGNCEVFLDILDVDSVKDMGIHSWIQEKIELAQFVVIVCSTGARFKCAKNRQFKMKQERETKITESFVWSVDYVAEKIRTSRQTGEGIDKFVVVYFDYAGEHDVPPKLDVAIRYPLMNDVLSLYCHLHGVKWETMAGSAPDALLDSGDQLELVDRENNNKVDAGQVLSYNGVTEDTFTQTSAGTELLNAINAAKTFFKDNPDWLGETLEAVGNNTTPVVNQKNQGKDNEKTENGKRDENSTTDESESPGNRSSSQESTPVKNKTNSDNGGDDTYKERQRRRFKEQEMQLDFLLVEDEKKTVETSKGKDNGNLTAVPNGPTSSIPLVNLTNGNSEKADQVQSNSTNIPLDKTSRRRLSKTSSNPNDGDSLRKEFQLNSPDFNRTRNPSEKRRNSKSQSNSSLQKMNGRFNPDDSVLSNGLDEESQLKKDIDFIHNFDAHHANVHDHSQTIPPLLSLQTNSLDRAQLAQPKRYSNDLDPIVLDLDLSEYTPPEDFITLANKLETSHSNASNGLINGIGSSMDPLNYINQDKEGFVNPIFDTNGNEPAVKSLNHFVIDFVDPSVKLKPDLPLNHRGSTST